MTTPRYIYDTEQETHRRMQSDPKAITSQTYSVKLIERSKSEAKVSLQENVIGYCTFNPWIMISGLDSTLTDEELKEKAIERLVYLRAASSRPII